MEELEAILEKLNESTAARDRAKLLENVIRNLAKASDTGALIDLQEIVSFLRIATYS